MIKKWCKPYVSVFLPCLKNSFPPFCLFDKKKKHKTVIKVHLFGFHADTCQSLIDLSEEKLHINIVHQTGSVPVFCFLIDWEHEVVHASGSV